MNMMTKKINSLQVKISSLVQKIQLIPAKKNVSSGLVYVLGKENKNLVSKIFEEQAQNWQKESLKDQLSREVIHFAGVAGPVWIFTYKNENKKNKSHHGRLEDSVYSWHRDQVGPILNMVKAYKVHQIQLEFHSTSEEQELGVFTGLEIASYSYKNLIDNKEHSDVPSIYLKKISGKITATNMKKAQNIGVAVNLSRHLVNSPPNELNPTTLSEFINKQFKNRKNLRLEVWNVARLKKEKMGLHLAVGQGSKTPPCMIHLQYRPLGKASKLKPIAFVGKGITFDTGGLDLKPSSNMRLMKKDMGGVAALIGLANWLANSDCKRPVDIYLGLAENSVDANSMRPSDVYIARNGMSVEIHNTDAEGRLVLADILDVAVSKKGKDEPEVVIDLATLTGAIKAGLGAEISGLFVNDDDLAEELNRAGAHVGEINWRMPLYSKYSRNFDSAFADIVNCVDGFGGAITAALFLEKFVQNKPWAHLDIYAWNDRPMGALTFSGGSGQGVQTLVNFLNERES
jgi:leucyl aminopeptidase